MVDVRAGVRGGREMERGAEGVDERRAIGEVDGDDGVAAEVGVEHLVAGVDHLGGVSGGPAVGAAHAVDDLVAGAGAADDGRVLEQGEVDGDEVAEARVFDAPRFDPVGDEGACAGQELTRADLAEEEGFVQGVEVAIFPVAPDVRVVGGDEGAAHRDAELVEDTGDETRSAATGADDEDGHWPIMNGVGADGR